VVGAIFLRQDTGLSPALPDSGNYPPFYRQPAATSAVTKTNTKACLLGGSSRLCPEGVTVFILYQKTTPTTELVILLQCKRNELSVRQSTVADLNAFGSLTNEQIVTQMFYRFTLLIMSPT